MKVVACLVVVIVILCILAAVSLGVGGFGPVRVVDGVTVTSKHVDVSRSGDSVSSHYMVSTDKGTFECDNGFLLGVWNADELYGKMVPGKTYRLKTKGNRVLGWFFQSYPFVLSVEEVQ